MSETINEALRLKSLLFWLDSVKRTDDLALSRRLWKNKDYEGFLRMFPECPFCEGAPVWDPTIKGEPVVINGIHVERVQCYCLSLKLLSKTQPHWFESYYKPLTLDAIKPIDIPPGAAERTRSIKTKIGKFLKNPTRSALINGKTGTAKSHILQAIKTEFGGFVVYITLSDFFSKLMKYVKQGDEQLGKFIDLLTYAPILCLDDYGLQHETPFGTNTLASIINSRYERARLAPIIMTTNLTLVEMEAVDGLSIDNERRILSRMMDSEVSTVMTMLQDDYRPKTFKKEAAL